MRILFIPALLVIANLIGCSKGGETPSGGNNGGGSGSGGGSGGGSGSGGNGSGGSIVWNKSFDSIYIGTVNTASGTANFTSKPGRTAKLYGSGSWHMEFDFKGKGSVISRTSTGATISIDPTSFAPHAINGVWNPNPDIHPNVKFFDSTQKKMVIAFIYDSGAPGSGTIGFLGNSLGSDNVLLSWKENNRTGEINIGN